ncbi:MAG TPA: hypothetical protein VFY24_02655 [Azospira sp.]|nr:hypothetical protein [Azospira sp.]
MGKLFLSMLIGVIAMLMLNDDARRDLRESLQVAASTATEAVRQ